MDGFVKFTEGVDGVDKVLRLICYTGKLTLSFAHSHSTYRHRLQALLNSLADARIVLRLFGIPQTVLWLNGIVGDQKRGFQQHYIELIQIASLLIYYPAEHVYWSGIHGALDLSQESLMSWSRWSCRAWLLYLSIDLVVLIKQFICTPGHLDCSAASTDSGIRLSVKVQEHLETEQKLKAERELMLYRAMALLGDIPLALTWSARKSFLNDFWVGLLGTISSISLIKLQHHKISNQ